MSKVDNIAAQIGPARQRAGLGRAGAVALLLVLGAVVAGCSTQAEIVRMPQLTGLPIEPLPLPEPTAVMSDNQKDAAIADMQAAARKNGALVN